MPTLFKRRHIREVVPEVIRPGDVEPEHAPQPQPRPQRPAPVEPGPRAHAEAAVTPVEAELPSRHVRDRVPEVIRPDDVEPEHAPEPQPQPQRPAPVEPGPRAHAETAPEALAHAEATPVEVELPSRQVREVVPEVIRPDDVEPERTPEPQPQPQREPAVEPEPRAHAEAAPEAPAHAEATPVEVELPDEEFVEDVALAASALEQPVEEDAVEAQAVAAPEELICTIRFWRGYRKGMFYAGMEEDGEDVAVAHSAPFRLPGGEAEPERTDAAVAAYNELRAELQAAGWSHVAEGADWYADTWRHPLTAFEEREPA